MPENSSVEKHKGRASDENTILALREIAAHRHAEITPVMATQILVDIGWNTVKENIENMGVGNRVICVEIEQEIAPGMTDLMVTPEVINVALAKEAAERSSENELKCERQLADALCLLVKFEFLRYASRTRMPEDRPDERFVCPVCGWPEGGHRGPGRIKGNAENTHEAGCSMYAVLHGQEAPRIANNPIPTTHPLSASVSSSEQTKEEQR